MKLVDFFDADKHQSFLTVDFNTLDIKVFYIVIGMIMETWWAWWWEWSSILKVLKVIILSCLYSISKKKLWMKFSIFDVSYRFMMKLARKRKFLCFCVLLRCKTFRYLLGSCHVCCYLFLGCCGQKWGELFRLWNSEIYCISREWIDKMSWFFCMLIQI